MDANITPNGAGRLRRLSNIAFKNNEMISHALPALSAMLIAIAFILIFDRRSVVEMTFDGIQPSILIPGELATISWHTNVLRKGCDGQVTRQIIDAAGIVHPYLANQSVINPQNSPTQFTGTFRVPAGAVSGNGIHRTIATRWCNELQRLVWNLHDPIRDVPIVIAKKGE